MENSSADFVSIFDQFLSKFGETLSKKIEYQPLSRFHIRYFYGVEKRKINGRQETSKIPH